VLGSIEAARGQTIVICGATATGKSRLAIEVAQQLGSSILSADSRQVYREFDIGTAKPTREEQQLVPHYLIDLCDPTETLTVADYQQYCTDLIECEHAQRPESPPLLVGGTGLYIKAVAKGLKIPRVPPHPELRCQLEGLGQSYCYQVLQQLDVAAAFKIHPNDATRTLRALEVCYVTGRPMSEQQGENPPNYPILQLGLHCEPQAFDRRLRKRTHQMVEMGFVKEVDRLCRRYGTDLPLLNTLGYAEMKRYLADDMALDEAIEQTVLHTRQFAKRQRTWFKAYPEIEWFDADAPDLRDRILFRIDRFLTSCPRLHK